MKTDIKTWTSMVQNSNKTYYLAEQVTEYTILKH